MANLFLTDVCNRQCPYCFARSAMGGVDGTAGARYLSLPDAVRAADLLIASRVARVGLLGGEPTLHPAFVDLCRYLLARRLHVTVFTNGLTAPATLAALAAIAPEQPLTFVVNVNDPAITPPAEQERQRTFLTTLGARCEISLNLYRLDLDPSFAAELGERCGTSRRIRLGLAQPMVEAENQFLDAGAYREAAARVVTLVEAAFAHGGSVHLWACFPLARHRHIPLTAASRIDDLHRQFQEALDATRRERGAWGVFPACAACAYRAAGRCAGGCLAHALRLAPP
ncbi:MAG TPA: radical SAM protein [Polyangia bacterium]|jgi:hypothetical protein